MSSKANSALKKQLQSQQRVFDVYRVVVQPDQSIEPIRNFMVVDFRLGQIMFQESDENKQIVLALPMAQLRTVSSDRRGTGLLRLVFEDSREGSDYELTLQVPESKQALDLLTWLQHHITPAPAIGATQQNFPEPILSPSKDRARGKSGKQSRSIKWASESLSPRTASPRSPKSPLRESSRSNSPKSPAYDSATIARHFFEVADPDGTGFVTLRMLEESFRKLHQYRLRTSRRAKQTRKRHTDLLKRVKRLMIASGLESTADWFSVVSAHQNGRQNRKVLANVHVGEKVLREGIQQLVHECRRLDLAFQKRDVSDLMRAVDVTAKGHITLVDMENAIASLGDAEKAAIDPKYALRPEHVAVLSRLEQFMNEKSMRVEDLFNSIDTNPAEDIITVQKFRAALARDFLPAPKGAAQRSRRLQKSLSSEIEAMPQQEPSEKQLARGISDGADSFDRVAPMKIDPQVQQVEQKQEYVDTSGGGRPPWENPNGVARPLSTPMSTNTAPDGTSYPHVEKLFGAHYKRVGEPELQAVVLNMAGSIPSNVSGKAALLVHLEQILSDRNSKSQENVPMPAPLDSNEATRHPNQAIFTFGEGKLGFTVHGRKEDGHLIITVADVNESGQAIGLGVQTGDTIVSVSGTFIADLSQLEVQQLLKNATRPLVIGFEREDISTMQPTGLSDGESTLVTALQSESAPATSGAPPLPTGRPSAANWIRRMVSKKKKRYQQNGFDLDLTYVTPRCIAMGYPSTGTSGIFRNPASEVARFLKGHHSDNFWVFNLCSERSYNPGLFDGRVSVYPFDDHSPPILSDVARFCEEASVWMSRSPSNIVAVHCKAGKGRTGVMICSYLLWAREYTSADDALAFYGLARTDNGKGVTIPSQRRFVQYFEFLVGHHDSVDETRATSSSPTGFQRRMGADATAVQLLHNSIDTQNRGGNEDADDDDDDDDEGDQDEDDTAAKEGADPSHPATEDEIRARTTQGRRACERAVAQHQHPEVIFNGKKLEFPPVRSIELKYIELSSTPSLNQIGGALTPSFEIFCKGAPGEEVRYSSTDMLAMATYKRGPQPMHFNLPGCAVVNEVCITFYHNGSRKRQRIFELWVHTSYLPEDGRLVLTKNELDHAVKDKKCAIFPAGFEVRIGYELI
jgi:hypothetical protein